MPEVQRRPLPVLLYDGNCEFCSRWVRRWQGRTAGRVIYAPFQMQGVLERLAVPKEEAARAVQWIGPRGERAQGSDAVFRALGCDPKMKWLARLGRLPPLSNLASIAYRIIARNRGSAASVDWLLFGGSKEPPSYQRVHALYLRGLGLVYLIAFTSLRSQLMGLYGSRGIRPISQYQGRAKEALGDDAYASFPSVFWLGASDRALLRACTVGQLAALGLMAGVSPKLCCAILWATYLSFVSVGREFLSYQWDALLLEAGFNETLLAPVRPIRAGRTPSVPWYGVLLMRLLNFRLHFGSGLSKIQSGDTTWRDLTACDYHFETQPLPTRLGAAVHRAPRPAHKAITALALLVECAVPLLIFAPRRLRRTACGVLTGFQALIAATGNYGFFNLLTMIQGIWLLDDEFISRYLPSRTKPEELEVAQASPRIEPDRAPGVLRRIGSGLGRLAGIVLVAPVIALSAFEILGRLGWVRRKVGMPEALRRLDERAVPFRAVNSYGLFSVMTTTRPEIVIEGSDDGRHWREYRFRYKADDPGRPPRWVAPHQPRLDWQMWFAALGGVPTWFEALMTRLLEGAPEVLSLFAENPFPRVPPRYVRATLYEYRIARHGKKGEAVPGAHWERKRIGSYFPTARLAIPGEPGHEAAV